MEKLARLFSTHHCSLSKFHNERNEHIWAFKASHIQCDINENTFQNALVNIPNRDNFSFFNKVFQVFPKQRCKPWVSTTSCRQDFFAVSYLHKSKTRNNFLFNQASREKKIQFDLLSHNINNLWNFPQNINELFVTTLTFMVLYQRVAETFCVFGSLFCFDHNLSISFLCTY